MAAFSVVLLTATPSMQGSEASGAFVKIDGRECLLRSVELFLNRDNVKQIQLVVNPQAIEEAKRKYGSHLAFSGVKLVPGGPQWANQLAAAGEKIAPEITHVIVHDAARPILAYSDIDAIMAEAENHPIVALTTPLRANLVGINPAGKPVAFHTADGFMQVVTPWAYRKNDFLQIATSHQEPAAHAIALLKGSPLNFRVATAGDASLAKAMLTLLPKRKMRPADNPFDEAQW
ncbi:MAG: 2-C-methyl-D-erythritol 4-phosphate cytidylyltransferase [Planctomycetota bacterium]|nr:2-C-methyl-D-erythritol 4-phosphate cytidylyltransferase [Planctomycetota bacterium]